MKPLNSNQPIVTAVCVWPMSPKLLAALDERFGVPLDTYVNGSQVWIRDDGPEGEALEWRLHPVAGYQRPKGVATEDVFEAMTATLVPSSSGTAMVSEKTEPGAESQAPAGLPPLDEVWEGLECFVAYGEEVSPAALAATCAAVLGHDPHGVGMADHEAIATAWEISNRTISIVGALLAQLQARSA